MFCKPFLLSIFHRGNQGQDVFEFKCSPTSHLRRRTSQNTPRNGPMNSPPESESLYKGCFNTGVVFLVPAVPASIYKVSEDIIVNEGSNVTLTCFASGRPEPAITWRLLNPSGKDQPTVNGASDRLNICGVSLCQKRIFRRETGRVPNAEPRWVSACVTVRTAVETNVGFFIRTCHCAVMDGDALRVSVRRQR